MTPKSEQRSAVDPLEEPTRAFEAARTAEAKARERLKKAEREHAQTWQELTATRTKLADVIVAEAKRGRGNADMRRVTKYTSERIRQICRKAGVKPVE